MMEFNKWIEKQCYSFKESDLIDMRLAWSEGSRIERERTAKIVAAARNMCDVKGRYHSEIAMRELMEACGHTPHDKP